MASVTFARRAIIALVLWTQFYLHIVHSSLPYRKISATLTTRVEHLETAQDIRRSIDSKDNLGRVLLPVGVRPKHYQLVIEPHRQLKTLPHVSYPVYTFDGHATIDLDVTSASSRITLNSRNLTFITVSLTSGTNIL